MENRSNTENLGEEPILAEVIAGRLILGLNGMGGRLFLTPTRLYFVPLIGRADLNTSSKAAKWSAKLHDWPVHPQMLLNAATKPLTRDIDMPFEKIRRAEASRKNGLLLQCGDTRAVRTLEFAIFEKWWWPNMEKNVAARDRMLEKITQARQSFPGNL